MNIFIEGIKGSGKTMLNKKLAVDLSDHKAYFEGNYNPLELAWCSYLRFGIR
jgi:thymidylate kinase